MVLLIIIPFLNGYFIGNINPTFSDKPICVYEWAWSSWIVITASWQPGISTVIPEGCRPTSGPCGTWWKKAIDFQGSVKIKSTKSCKSQVNRRKCSLGQSCLCHFQDLCLATCDIRHSAADPASSLAAGWSVLQVVGWCGLYIPGGVIFHGDGSIGIIGVWNVFKLVFNWCSPSYNFMWLFIFIYIYVGI